MPRQDLPLVRARVRLADGAQAESFGGDQGLPSPYINQIVEGPDGAIYVLEDREGARLLKLTPGK